MYIYSKLFSTKGVELSRWAALGNFNKILNRCFKAANTYKTSDMNLLMIIKIGYCKWILRKVGNELCGNMAG